MTIHPISENQADEKTKRIYQMLKNSLKTDPLPIFFTYLSLFPEYFSFLTNQIIPNLNEKDFNFVVNQEYFQEKFGEKTPPLLFTKKINLKK